MTNEEAIAIIRKEYLCVDRDCDIERSCGKCDLMMLTKEPILEAYNMAIKALEQEPKTGHWIDTGSGQECSECHEIQYGYDSNRKYCANCGFRMIEPQERNEKE